VGYDLSFFANPDLSDATLQALTTNEVLVGSGLLIFGSLTYLFVTSVLVNIIFPIRKSKSFEQGNKRVAAAVPEFPAL
jgi:hypothetical protein